MASKSRNTYKSKKNTPAPEQAIVEGLLRGLGQILIWGYKKLTKADLKEKYSSTRVKLHALQEHWENVEMHVLQESTRALAISEGDKILDSAFKIIGLPGETMGDRLKAAESRFNAELYQRIWQAHKLRNVLAHELGTKVNAEEAKYAVNTFRQALYQLGVL